MATFIRFLKLWQTKTLVAIVLVSAILMFVQNVLASTNWQYVGSPGFSNGAIQPSGITDNESMAVDFSNTPYVAYQDSTRSNKITVMKFNGSSWQTVGTAGFSVGQAQYIKMAIGPSNVPYVVYDDVGLGDEASVMKFNGSSWGYVGTPGISAGKIYYPDLAFSPAGTPYVSYTDYNNTNSDHLTVMKFNGSSWQTVGTAGFSPTIVWNSSLAFDSSGAPYVAYSYAGSGYSGAYVYEFNGSSWQTVGNAGFAPSSTENINLVIDSSNTPYIAYADWGNGLEITVRKLNSGIWQSVSAAGIPADSTELSLKLDSFGAPYVAYGDPINLMKFNGSIWQSVGAPNFSGQNVSYHPTLSFNSSNVPYVSYEDGGHGDHVSVQYYVGAPAITSSNNTSVTSGDMLNFTVTTTGSPTPSINETGSLPPGVLFQDNGNGTASLYGTPTKSGTYDLQLNASNLAGNTSQNFTLLVSPSSSGSSGNDCPNGTSAVNSTSGCSATAPGQTGKNDNASAPVYPVAIPANEKTIVIKSIGNNGETEAVVAQGLNLSTMNYTVPNKQILYNDGSLGTVIVSKGATMKGSGAVIDSLTIEKGATLAPGHSPGCLSAGRLLLYGSYEAQIGGDSPCASYDQVTGGQITLAGVLSLRTIAGFKPQIGQVFTIIKNTGDKPVNGTFFNLPENAVVSGQGIGYTISYHGGTGNDVTIKVVSNSSSLASWGLLAGNTLHDRVRKVLPYVITVLISLAVIVIVTLYKDLSGNQRRTINRKLSKSIRQWIVKLSKVQNRKTQQARRNLK